MKTIYIVTNCGYRPAVAFEDKERAEAVRAMCDGSVDEVQVLDAAPPMIDLLKDMDKWLAERNGVDESDLGDGGECDGGAE